MVVLVRLKAVATVSRVIFSTISSEISSLVSEKAVARRSRWPREVPGSSVARTRETIRAGSGRRR